MCAGVENGVDVSRVETGSFEPSCTMACLSGGEEHPWASQPLCWSQAWCSWRGLRQDWAIFGVRLRRNRMPPFHSSSPCSLILLWAKDTKGEKKKSRTCLIASVLWSRENKKSLFNSDYSAIVNFCFCMYYTAYKVCKILACFFLLDITKEDTGKSQWNNMQLVWPIAYAEISAAHAAVVECLSCFTFNP